MMRGRASAFVLVAAALGLVGCSGKPSLVLRHPSMVNEGYNGSQFTLSASERAFLERTPDKVLPLVTDDTEAKNALLRTPSLPLDPSSPGVELLLERMRRALKVAKGVGLAAPQIGVNRRVALVQRYEAVGNKRAKCDEKRCPVKAYFNPTVLRHLGGDDAEDKRIGWEGCLSVRRGFGKIARSQRIVVRYQDGQGRWHQEKVQGFTARIFQHEIDHLAGMLFIDRRQPGKLMSKEAYREMRAREAAASKEAASDKAASKDTSTPSK